MADNVEIKGGCHCGYARYVAKVSSASLKDSSRCNCTFCNKLAMGGFQIQPSDFKLLSPNSIKELGDYYTDRPGTENKMHRYFCTKCGTHIWQDGSYEFHGVHKIFSITLRSIDQPQSSIDLSQVKFKYIDGLNDNFEAGLKDVPYPGGLL